VTAADDETVDQTQETAAGSASEEADTATDTETRLHLESVRAVAPTIVGAILSFGLLLIFRINTYPLVLRDGAVISPLNDPYYYRYWMDQSLADATGPADMSILSGTGEVAFDSVRPATHALNWWLAELVGPDAVTAWLPVVSSLIVGALLCGIAYNLTRDLRVGFATVGMLAFVPLHAIYSGLGYLEHKPHQYVWLGLLLAGLVWLAVHVQREDGVQHYAGGSDVSAPLIWGVAVLTGVAVGVYTHTAGSTPLFVVMLLIYVLARTPMELRAGQSPVSTMGPIFVVTAVGAALAIGLHELLNWGETFVVFAPVGTMFGVGVILLIGEGWRYINLPVAGFISVGVIGTVGSTVGMYLVFPDTVEQYRQRSEDLFGREGIAETVSLFDPGILSGPMLRLGVGFLIAIPVLVWLTAVVTRRYEPGWLVLVIYGWGSFILAVIQNRFAGQLSLLIAVFAGVGIVTLLGRLGVIRPLTTLPHPRALLVDEPESDTAGSTTDRAHSSSTTTTPVTRLEMPTTRREYLGVGGSIAITGAVSAVLVDGQTTQTSYSDAEYRAMQAIVAHEETVSRTYPANFVLSRWGASRMYNYFTSGESESYGFARRTYPEFLSEERPDEWARDQLGRVGYVVIHSDDADLPAGTAYQMLQERLGVAMADRDPLAHYQLLYLAGSGDNPDQWELSAFAVVPGARIQGSGTPGETVTAGTEVTVSEVSFPYQQAATVDEEGAFELTVPYPGTYTVGETEVSVSESAVVAGDTLSIE